MARCQKGRHTKRCPSVGNFGTDHPGDLSPNPSSVTSDPERSREVAFASVTGFIPKHFSPLRVVYLGREDLSSHKDHP